MPVSKAILSCLVVSLLGVLAPFSNAQTTKLTFDSGAGSDTSSPPGYVDASVYFAAYGISMSSITPGTQVVIINNNGLYGGTATVPPSPPNLLTQFGLNSAISFTLTFPSPLTNISFTRAGLIASTASGVTHPQWSAHAIDSQGVEVPQLSPVGELLFGSYTNVPARTFTLTGSDITSLRFDSDARNFAGFSGVLLDDLTLSPLAPPASNVNVTVTPTSVGSPAFTCGHVSVTDSITNNGGTLVSNLKLAYYLVDSNGVRDSRLNGGRIVTLQPGQSSTASTRLGIPPVTHGGNAFIISVCVRDVTDTGDVACSNFNSTVILQTLNDVGLNSVAGHPLNESEACWMTYVADSVVPGGSSGKSSF